VGDDLWYFTMRSSSLPLLRTNPVTTEDLSARAFVGLLRDHQIPDFLKARKQPTGASQLSPNPTVKNERQVWRNL
jgi:hypothetical protein